MGDETIWAKIDPRTTLGSQSAPSDGSGTSLREAFPVKSGVWRSRIAAYDVVSTVFWVWLIVKVFVGDVDRWISKYIPILGILLDFRLLVVVAAVTMIVVAGKKAWLGLPYVVLFPVVFLFWKTPKTLLRLRSWNGFLVFVNASYVFCRKFKRNLVIRVLELISAVLVITTDVTYILIPCLVILALGLLYHYGQTAISAVRTSRFLKNQQELVRRILKSESIKKTYEIDPKLRDPEIEKFDKEQVQVFANSVSAGLVVWKMLDIYTYALGRYRRGVAPMLFGLASVVWIFLQSVVFLTFINAIVQKLDPSQFDNPSPSVPALTYYSISALFANTVPVLGPTGDATIVINIISAVYGPILVLTLTAQLLLGYRQARDDASFLDIVREVRRNRLELEVRLKEEYEVTPEDALRRIIELSLGMGPILNYLLQKLPDAFESSEQV